MQCRLGIIDKSSSECDGILVANTLSEAKRIRDASCSLAKEFGDTLLLFDFLYERSRNFASLRTDDEALGKRVTDFRVSPLTKDLQTELDRRDVSDVFQELVDQLSTGDNESGVVKGIICDPEKVESCEVTMSGFSPAYATSVLDRLRGTGSTGFSMDDACYLDDQGDPHCHPYLIVGEEIRQRVVDMVVKPLMAEGYRLGCTEEYCPIPDNDNIPPDTPLVGGYQFYMDFMHGPMATFLVDNVEDDKYQTVNFSNHHAQSLCRLAGNYIEDLDLSCEDVVHFKTSYPFERPSQLDPYFDALYQVSEIVQHDDNPNPRLFGTSIRGDWEISIRDTIVQLNSAGDDCYDEFPGEFNTDCLPDECCILVECTEGEPDCTCNENGECNRETCCLPGACSDEDMALLPEYCQIDTDNSVPVLFSACAPYVTMEGDTSSSPPIIIGALNSNGDSACCTPGGHRRTDLDATAASACNDAGWTEDSCSTPEDCYRICGPECKAFKDAIIGLKFAIGWRK